MPAIYLIGAGGFIGSHLSRALRDAGHRVVPGARFAGIDADALRGIDVAINAAGIFRESGEQTFEAVHVRGPLALFRVCAQLGVRVIQFSALGADAQASTRFHLTKKAADDALLALDLDSVVLQPSLVHGPGGESARLFCALASMPLVPLPGDGSQPIQPVHIDDVCAAVLAVIERDFYPRKRIALVGAKPTTVRGHLEALGASRFIQMPLFAARWAGGNDAIAMLERGNTADAAPLAELLGRAPRPAGGCGVEAKLAWLLPLLRLGIALVWLIAGVVSLGLYPVAESLALLARAGLSGTAAQVALYVAAALDIAMAVLTIFRPGRMLWLAQMVLILVYTAILTISMPELWLHPFGPLAKNLPLLAALGLLVALEKR
jgi:uncharacterized protein YbjT (DUF2867 family)